MAPTVVVGAGLAGLQCARTLAAAGHDVVLVDKGRSPGGRMATRRLGDATVDHGAQYFTVRTPALQREVDGWLATGLVREWCRGFGDGDGYPRFAVTGGMNALAKHLAAGLDVRCGHLAFAVRPAAGRWSVVIDDGTDLTASALVITTPVPQALSLLVTSGVELPETLRTLDYDRTLSLLAVLDGPSAVPAPGGVQEADGTFAFVADNLAKGVSTASALTLHARPALSEARWDADRDEVHAELLAAGAPWFGGSRVVASQVKRWRFATPRTTWAAPCWLHEGGPAPLVLAGDAFGGPRAEGALVSGAAAAQRLLA
jgi:predicted NAD/FAD-dependent oxidoreductase